ncbi:S-adenosyl-L-methionine-dependent tRNA 4-demethylwyosine synthase [Pelobates cultripes]|uniref:tRNA 4-demethylwyosine synthase (AdoMet-dependent) n=1 Tax=Pelobates cultripes TaxID=61616 RepID=A0AAD1R464_PELCU|nr:S-adenosyl-L-methionine-dependent tRNA 4-demethylwyosine synthase [Pelobates cultripes]CAH2222743.1 S-adenosyl-L-methionine-dependent tRNA 4-demethylwyosine synthase [Pelobates cultripes]CAH2222744.1 S-adenosyl-L-methionine-dependent tRNA 4-demethylwyosine synthase [Pelobates cultripes]CAH2222745.1 S-adenosyl-L-methionine-dependent tRNA 4-demethylwyosine synthase [Pelobates cultripes]CAH2222747.1 S-adenosyl-L-methionine-dependent tRNA 4-demethylwyosine synthase [Pelobates cultripes]
MSAMLHILCLCFMQLVCVSAEHVDGDSTGTLDYFYTHLKRLWLNRFYIYSCAAFGVTIWICSHFISLKTKDEQYITQNGSTPVHSEKQTNDSSSASTEQEVHVSGVKIFYGSQTGTAKGFAHLLAEDITDLGLPINVINLKEYDPDDHLVEETTSRNICVFLVATYTDGQPPEGAEWFCKWLEEASNDFRFGKTFLKGLRYAVFGLGNSVYSSHYNVVGKNIDKWLWMLSANRIMTRAEGDCNVIKSKNGSIEADFSTWKATFMSRLQALMTGEKKACSGKCKKGKCKSKQESTAEDIAQAGDRMEDSESDHTEEELYETTSDSELEGETEAGSSGLIDVEDLGKAMNNMKKVKRTRNVNEEDGTLGKSLQSKESKESEEPREMITPALQKALTKQGYKLIGSHSGVKLCRWTKSMLRGRGGCYKHTFYGIESHRCMETTPSLACANKCVFCWRHHTNPVGTEWRWKMDQPEMILEAAIENHQNMIKQFRGVPGVKPDRFEEGMAVKHCALSLVGEPIMYPEINRFLRLLHHRQISSFLVTNAQFPDEIRCLEPVTQLYVSVDASTKDSLKKIDRPLFKDFWQRFIDSLKALAEKKGFELTFIPAPREFAVISPLALDNRIC